MPDPADKAVADEFHSVAKHGRGALLRAGLKDRPTLGHLAVQRLALGEKVSDRFFAIDVLAVAERLERLHRMPMVGRGDNHNVEIFASTQFAVVDIHVARLRAVFFTDHFSGWFAAKRATLPLSTVMGLIRVAGGDDLRVWFSEERVHHTHAPAATANKADGDAVARRWFARLAKHG